jgi:hypothetical protein
LTYAITGPDAIDFDAQRYNRARAQTIDPFAPGSCTAGPQALECTTTVEFRPQSIGPKSATLVVTDNHGNRATAALKGMGVAALCKVTIVPCNYAHHYSGVVSWAGGNDQVNVDVVRGMASCNSSITDGGGPTTGPGLIAVELDQSKEGRVSSTWYRITVACPIRYQPDPALPAEMGHGEIGSYKQPLLMTIEDAHNGLVRKRSPRLRGTHSQVAGETVSWDLCPDSLFQPGVRVRNSSRQGRCLP